MNLDSSFNKFHRYDQSYIILKIIDGPDKGKEFKINLNCSIKSFLLGRDAIGSEAYFRINNIDKYVSRNHCIFEVTDFADIYLIDNNSLNGTWIYRKGYPSFKRMKSKVKLDYNDIILIGNTSIMMIKGDNINSGL